MDTPLEICCIASPSVSLPTLGSSLGCRSFPAHLHCTEHTLLLQAAFVSSSGKRYLPVRAILFRSPSPSPNCWWSAATYLSLSSSDSHSSPRASSITTASQLTCSHRREDGHAPHTEPPRLLAVDSARGAVHRAARQSKAVTAPR